MLMRTVTREKVVATARAWIGTPYHHQASERGVGADCLGLVRGVWRDLYDSDAEMPPAYSRDWAEASGEETLLTGAARHLTAKDIADVRPGDVVIFRLRPGLIAKHTAIIATDISFVHSIEGAPACEVPLGIWWRRRMAGAFSFPGVVD